MQICTYDNDPEATVVDASNIQIKNIHEKKKEYLAVDTLTPFCASKESKLASFYLRSSEGLDSRTRSKLG